MAGIISDNISQDSNGIVESAFSYYSKALSFLGQGADTPEKKREKGEIVDYTTGATKFSAKDGDAEIYIQKSSIILSTESDTAIGINDGCLILDGRVHMSGSPDDIYMQGFWKFNEELLTTVPSTLSNPVQTLLYVYPPYVKKVSKIISALPV